MNLMPPPSQLFDAQIALQPFLEIIPSTLAPKQKEKQGDVTRTRKLPLPRLITLTLSLVGNGDSNGVDIHIGNFFRNARRSGI